MSALMPNRTPGRRRAEEARRVVGAAAGAAAGEEEEEGEAAAEVAEVKLAPDASRPRSARTWTTRSRPQRAPGTSTNLNVIASLFHRACSGCTTSQDR